MGGGGGGGGNAGGGGGGLFFFFFFFFAVQEYYNFWVKPWMTLVGLQTSGRKTEIDAYYVCKDHDLL